MSSNIKKEYISDQTQRTLRIVKVLAGHEKNGLSPGEMAEKADISRTNITRIIANLQLFQWVEPVPGNSKRFRLAPGIVHIANTVAINLRESQLQLSQDLHNYNGIATTL